MFEKNIHLIPFFALAETLFSISPSVMKPLPKRCDFPIWKVIKERLFTFNCGSPF